MRHCRALYQSQPDAHRPSLRRFFVVILASINTVCARIYARYGQNRCQAHGSCAYQIVIQKKKNISSSSIISMSSRAQAAKNKVCRANRTEISHWTDTSSKRLRVENSLIWIQQQNWPERSVRWSQTTRFFLAIDAFWTDYQCLSQVWHKIDRAKKKQKTRIKTRFFLTPKAVNIEKWYHRLNNFA